METASPFVATCVPADNMALVIAASRLALTGKPVLGRPATKVATFARACGPVLLLAVRGDTGLPVGLAVWNWPGPSERIASATLTDIAVSRDVSPEESDTIIRLLAVGVRYQFEYATRIVARRGGYVVTTLKLNSRVRLEFEAVGWEGLQPAADAASIRYVAFVEPPEQDSVDDEVIL